MTNIKGCDNISNVTLSEYLSGKCKYKGCNFNELGICNNNDKDFLDGIQDLIINLEEYDNKDNINIDCIPSIEDGCCPYCGIKLKIDETYLPYGDTYVPLKTKYCPKCE